jgi:cytochrome b
MYRNEEPMASRADMQPAGHEPAATRQPTMVPVWDRFVRFAHWTIVFGFFVAYFTEDDLLTLHVWAGYVVGVIATLRIAWGLVGPKHARFTDFLYRPTEVIAYLRDLGRRRGERYLGHSPAGGVMITVLLIGLLVTVGAGLVLYAIDDHSGPLAGLIASTGRGGPWKEIHELLANLMLVLVGVHVAGVLLASYVHRENLVKAMVTGRKRPLSA